MPTEKKIKIIKHAERNDLQAAVGLNKRRTSARNHAEDTKRDAVTIVTEWVRELRRKKALEAAHGFQSVFGKAG
jgi:hypothetical protein